MVRKSENYQNKINNFNQIKISRSSVLILGDSRFEKVFTEISNEVNLSVGGETTKSLSNRILPYNFKDSINIILGIGINDLLFSYQRSKILKNLDNLIHLILKKTNHSTLYLCKILPINSMGFFYNKVKINYDLNIINSFMENLIVNTNNNDKKVIDFNDLIGFDNSLLFSDDGIHLNKEGISIMNNTIIKSLK
jgi:lysophospholipase L1-like esterase